MPASPDVALLSIKPEYADAIFAGTKSVEFRRRGLAPSIKYVVVYSTLPEGRVVGMCRVARVREAAPSDLWDEVGARGAIGKDAYDAYFAGATRAYGIELEAVIPFEQDVDLTLHQLGASRPPQSFQYVRESGRERVLALAG